jgi:hypothetical protein
MNYFIDNHPILVAVLLLFAFCAFYDGVLPLGRGLIMAYAVKKRGEAQKKSKSSSD